MPPLPNSYRRELNAWRVMIRRCTEPAQKDWKYYGGKGVTICQQWLASFENFLVDMGPAPTQRHWLGRRDVSGNYEPANCLWTTQPEQERRRGCCRRVNIRGQSMVLAEAGRSVGVNPQTIARRQASGLPLENPPAAKLYRASKWLTHQGETLPLPEWARRIGLPAAVLWFRVKRGMSLELALTPRRFRNHAPRSTP